MMLIRKRPINKSLLLKINLKLERASCSVLNQYLPLRLVALQQHLSQVVCLVQALDQVCLRSHSQLKLQLEVYLAQQLLDSILEVAHLLSFLDRRMALNRQVQFLEQSLLGRQDHYLPQQPNLVAFLEI